MKRGTVAEEGVHDEVRKAEERGWKGVESKRRRGGESEKKRAENERCCREGRVGARRRAR